VEPSAAEQVVIKAARRAKLFVGPRADILAAVHSEGVWDENVGDWPVTWPGLDDLSVCRCQRRVRRSVS
jgi:hypothetical protein